MLPKEKIDVSDTPKVDPIARLLYVLLRYDMDLNQAGFAAKTRTAASQVSIYDRGKTTVPEAVLQRAADAREFPRNLIQPARRAIRSFRAAARGWSRTDRVLAERFFAELLGLSGEALEVIFAASAPAAGQQVTAASAATDRALAAELWLRLERRTASQRLVLVEELEELRSPALCELVSARSIEAAPNSPAEALELAGLALRVAELYTGDDLLQQRTEGYAWFHVGNARRVTNDLRGSGVALETAKRLWKAGASGDPGFFNEAIVLGLEASIRKSQCRFPDALGRIEEALAADQGDLRGKLLLTKAQILGALGDIEASTEVLREADLHIDEEREPRTALGVRCRFLVNLCLQGRALEAAPRLREVQALAEQLGQEVDLVHVTFIRGKIAAGTGQAEEAEEIF